MRIESDIKLDYQDVLLKPKRSTLSSRKEVDIEREFTFYHTKKKWKGVPILTANMNSCGTFEMAKALSKHKIITTFHKFYSLEEYEEFFKDFDDPDYICYSMGIRESDLERFQEMHKSGLLKNFSFICLDVPNAYISVFSKYVAKVREMCPDHIIIAGNVVTNELAEDIILSGADIVKVGIGSGSVCTTRRMTGVGYPQLSATIECSDAVHGIANENGVGRMISDGGIVHPSDISKSYCAGTDFVMVGSLFSGFEEAGGETVEKNGKKYKEYFGSSSNVAMMRNYGKKESHRASEGRYALIPYKGLISDFIQDLLGSIRSTGTYIGARSLKEFPRRATFIQVNRQLNESNKAYDVDEN